MNLFLRKTFGGLNTSYYFRQLFFGALIGGFPIYSFIQNFEQTDIGILIFLLISTLLYPYSRFVCERIVGFILGENQIIVNSILFLLVKYFTMAICFAFAIFIAPLGLIYLYVYHTKAIKS
ncbi:MAG: hypothetical protein H6622_08455 [Halobacteriovoraceae bacterium]|nr:hypothetical protein [Halobacteriovoraceae bacterium]